MKKSKELLVIAQLISLYFLLSCVNVYATSDSTRTMCLNNKAYQVTWNRGTNTNISEDKILENIDLTINTGYISLTQTTENKLLEVKDKGYTCICNDSSKASCKYQEFTSCYSKISEYNGMYQKLTLSFNSKTGWYVVYLANDAKNANVQMRIIPKNSTYYNGNHQNLSSLNNNYATLRSGTQTYSIQPNEIGIIVELYLNDGSPCSGTYLGSKEFSISSNVLVDNPAVASDTASGYSCNKVYNYSNASDQQKQAYIPECYYDTILYTKLASLQSTIINKYNELVDNTTYVNQVQGWSTQNNLTCNTDNNYNYLVSESTFIMNTSNNQYWEARCTETITAHYDTPKYTTAGGGFTYNTWYTISRKCTPIMLRSIELKPQCQYIVLSDGGISNSENNPNGAGPTEEFDSCINTCDGGKYTQSCINSCYKSVYEDKSYSGTTNETKSSDILLLSGNDFLSFTDEVVTIATHQYVYDKHVAYTPTGWSISGFDEENCYTHVPAFGALNCETPTHHVKYRYSDACISATNPTTITEYITNGPEGTNCYDNPQAVYTRQITASRNEYLDLMNKMASYTDVTGSYTYQITDSYLTTANGENYIYEVNSTNASNPLLKVETTSSGPNYTTRADGKTNIQIGSQGDMLISQYNSFNLKYANSSVSTTAYIYLPQSYIHKNTGTAVYKSANQLLSINSKAQSFTSANVDQTTGSYYDGGNKYYTDLHSKAINVKSNWGTDGFTPTYNIKVVATGLGTKHEYSGSGTCFYGLGNYFTIPDNPGPNTEDGYPTNPPSNPTGGDDTTAPYGSGIQYIFRPVDLTNLFPSRNARWNWTSAAAASGGKYLYTIDPTSLINDIESKGNNIYTDSELDYEIILTTANIRAIRNYNKKTNYLSFNMECSGSFCKSNFLGNGTYISNAGAVRRNATIGTNND